MQYCFGVDIGGTSVKLGLFTDEGIVIDKWEIVTRREERGAYVLGDVAKTIEEKLLEKSIEKSQVIGIGIGVPGPITEEGMVLKCANLGWDIFNVVEKMEEMIGIKVRVGNDANVAALGEAWQGGGKGGKSVIMVTLGTGVGGGVIINGSIITGNKGASGEIGHMLVNYEEADICGCGKTGCLEQYASATGIVNETKRLLARSKEASVLRESKELTAKDVFDAAKQGDALANQSVNQLCRYLAIALSHVAATIDPEVFVIGGGVSKAGTIITDRVKEYYDTFVIYALKGKKFELAKLGNDAGIYGCAKLALGK